MITGYMNMDMVIIISYCTVLGDEINRSKWNDMCSVVFVVVSTRLLEVVKCWYR